MAKTRTPEERHKLNKEIGARCKKARIAAGLTQEQTAEKLNVSTQYISDMERGVAGLSLLTMIELSNILSVTTDYLMKGQTTEHQNYVQIGTRMLALSDREYELLEKIITATLQAFHVNETS